MGHIYYSYMYVQVYSVCTIHTIHMDYAACMHGTTYNTQLTITIQLKITHPKKSFDKTTAALKDKNQFVLH